MPATNSKQSFFDKATNEVGDKVAVVTGAASGIARAVVELFHARGAKVIADDINPAFTNSPVTVCSHFVADVTKDGTAEKAMQLALEKFGRVDILVNNAGYINYKALVETSREEWDKVIDTNLTGYFLHSREAMKVMLQNKSGAIINIASYASYFAFPDIAPYAASKGGVAQLTRALALEAAPHGIRVNAVGSGDVVTKPTQHLS